MKELANRKLVSITDIIIGKKIRSHEGIGQSEESLYNKQYHWSKQVSVSRIGLIRNGLYATFVRTDPESNKIISIGCKKCLFWPLHLSGYKKKYYHWWEKALKG